MVVQSLKSQEVGMVGVRPTTLGDAKLKISYLVLDMHFWEQVIRLCSPGLQLLFVDVRSACNKSTLIHDLIANESLIWHI